MALPDPYVNEPTVEVTRDKVRQWIQARDAVAQWKKIEEEARRALEEEVGDAWAGTLDGEKVFTYRPIDRWAEARLMKEQGELTQHYIKPQVIDVFDLASFRAQHPDVADRYQSRQFRAAE